MIDYLLWKSNFGVLSKLTVIEYGNFEVIREDNVFWIDELFDPYRLTPFIKLENTNF